MIETLWKDDEHPTFVSGTVSTVHDEEDEDKFKKQGETKEMDEVELEILQQGGDDLIEEVKLLVISLRCFLVLSTLFFFQNSQGALPHF